MKMTNALSWDKIRPKFEKASRPRDPLARIIGKGTGVDLRRILLSSKRLSLAAFTPGDAPEIFDAVTPTLTRFMAFEPSLTPAAFAGVWRAWLPRMAAGTELYLVLRLKSTDEFLGIAGLHGIGNAEPEIGIWTKERAHGFGYGREAIATLIVWASRECGAQAFIYPVVEVNGPSRRLAEKLGGVVIGTRRLAKAAGIEHPEVVYRIAPLEKPRL